MINFKSREEMLPSALILISIVMMVVTLAYMVFVPTPSAEGVVAGRERSRRTLQAEIAAAKARSADVEAAIRPRLWTGNTETVTAAVLAQVTAQANARKLKMSAFRPQRAQTLAGVTEIPFVLQISGPYPAVRSAVAAMDVAGSRLALRSVQIATADAATSAVTATVAISAYAAQEQAPRTTTRPTTPTPAARPTTGGSRG